MGDLYLTDLADVLRRAGCQVIEHNDWQYLARGSGGYEPGRPTTVMVHPTASPPSWSGQRDADYCQSGDEDAPLSNLYLDRSGQIWVLAAGCTNTNGKGRDYWGGGVPDDSMNTYAIGIEANGGYGDPWPKVQQDAYLVAVAALCDAYGISTDCVRGHFEWAPDRKIDPAGPSKWSTDSSSWDMDGFRADIITTTPTPPPPAELDLGAIHDQGDPMFITSKDGTYWIGNGLGRRACKDHDEVDFLIDKFELAGTPLVNFQGGQPVNDRGQVNSSQQLNRLGVVVS